MFPSTEQDNNKVCGFSTPLFFSYRYQARDIIFEFFKFLGTRADGVVSVTFAIGVSLELSIWHGIAEFVSINPHAFL
jgi:hypothetical protein